MLALFKHAKNFVGNKTRPIFEGIHYDGERAIVTNTHVLIIVENQPSEVKTIHYKTGQPIAGEYPDAKRIIPEKTKINFEIPNIKEWIDALKPALLIEVDEDYAPPKLSCKDGVVLLEVKSAPPKKQKYEVVLPCVGEDEFEVSFRIKYLHDILAFFKDVNVKKVCWGINDAKSTMKLSTTEGVLALLSPIRIK